MESGQGRERVETGKGGARFEASRAGCPILRQAGSRG